MKPLGFLITDAKGERFIIDSDAFDDDDDLFWLANFKSSDFDDLRESIDTINLQSGTDCATREDAEVYLENLRGMVKTTLRSKLKPKDLKHYLACQKFLKTAVVKELKLGLA